MCPQIRIDTLTVIDRVATLFIGRPALIKGFNTFLPLGYHVTAAAQADSTLVTITTPEGTTARTLPS
jgi:paired amphipathic helix protein Sin3a